MHVLLVCLEGAPALLGGRAGCSQSGTAALTPAWARGSSRGNEITKTNTRLSPQSLKRSRSAERFASTHLLHLRADPVQSVKQPAEREPGPSQRGPAAQVPRRRPSAAPAGGGAAAACRDLLVRWWVAVVPDVGGVAVVKSSGLAHRRPWQRCINVLLGGREESQQDIRSKNAFFAPPLRTALFLQHKHADQHHPLAASRN